MEQNWNEFKQYATHGKYGWITLKDINMDNLKIWNKNTPLERDIVGRGKDKYTIYFNTSLDYKDVVEYGKNMTYSHNINGGSIRGFMIKGPELTNIMDKKCKYSLVFLNQLFTYKKSGYHAYKYNCYTLE